MTLSTPMPRESLSQLNHNYAAESVITELRVPFLMDVTETEVLTYRLDQVRVTHEPEEPGYDTRHRGRRSGRIGRVSRYLTTMFTQS